MWKLKPSPRVLKAAEKYVTSLGRKREELTDEQWNLMVKYTQGRRLGIPFLIFFGLVCAIFTATYYQHGQKFAKDILPSQVITITYEDQRESIYISPEKMRKYLNYATNCYMNAGMQLMLTIQFLIFFVGSVTLSKTMNIKTHRILLSRPPSTGIVD